MESISHPSTSILVRWSWSAATWALLYALYRGYYAAGGTYGMFGTPASQYQWLLINTVAAVLLCCAALLPIALLKMWHRGIARPALLALCWVVAVGCVSHALIGILQRIASLGGALWISYPFWSSIDRRAADLQALFFNEPWFLIEGLLWVGIAWGGGLRASSRRKWWFITAIAVTAGATATGLLSAFGVIGKIIIG